MNRLDDAYAEQHMLDFLAREPYKSLVPEQTAPGYPLGYVRERVTIICKCGNVTRYSRLLVVDKASTKSRKIRPCGVSEVVYDLAHSEINATGGTPVCDVCWPGARAPVATLTLPKVSHKADLTLSLNDIKDLL